MIDAGTSRSTFLTWMVVVDPIAGALVAAAARLVDLAARDRPARAARRAGSTPPRSRRCGRAAGSTTSRRCSRAAGPFPLTLGIGPETLEAWRSAAKTRTRARGRRATAYGAPRRARTDAAPARAVRARSTGPTIEAEGLGTHVPTEYVAGSSADRAGDRPDPRSRGPRSSIRSTTRRSAASRRCSSAASSCATRALVAGRRAAHARAAVRADDAHRRRRAGGRDRQPGSSSSSRVPDRRRSARAARRSPRSPRSPTRRRRRHAASCSRRPTDWSPDVATVSLLLRDLARRSARAARDARHAVLGRRAGDANGGRAPAAARAQQRHDATCRCARATTTTAARELTRVRVDGRRQGSVGRGRPPRAAALALDCEHAAPRRSRISSTIAAKLDALTSGITTTAKTLTLTARRAEPPAQLPEQHRTRRTSACACTSTAPKLIFPEGPRLRASRCRSGTRPPSAIVPGRGARVGHVRDDDHARVARRDGPARARRRA